MRNQVNGRFEDIHGMTDTRLYATWCGMKERCYNKSNKRYKNYGARGIEICANWMQDFRIFRDWAFENGYDDTLTIDRINNDGNYEPNNCKWSTRKEQNRNYSRNHRVEYEGKSYCLIELAEAFEIPYGRLTSRLHRGWDIKMSLTRGDLRYGK